MQQNSSDLALIVLETALSRKAKPGASGDAPWGNGIRDRHDRIPGNLDRPVLSPTNSCPNRASYR